MIKKNEWVKTKKLTKANSHMSNETIFYIAKKLSDEKPAKQYWAYLYPDGIVVYNADDKNELKKKLDMNISKIEEKISLLGL